MFSGKDAVNPSYPTQWALNPTAYQNIDSSQVDWAALAQQWIAMKEAASIVSVPQPPPKPDLEGGEAEMEVENADANCEGVPPPGAEWNASTNSWSNSWNQWGWGWGGNDSKMAADSSMSPLMDGYPVPCDNAAPMPGYTTGQGAAPTFQHGYWTAPQAEQANNRSVSRNREQRSKSKNRDSKPIIPRNNNRPHREKVSLLPTVIDPVTMPMSATTSTIDAAKRRQLPAWIREGLEKMEREKQRAMEREQEMKARAEAEKEKKRLEEEELARIKAEASGQPMLPAKSKFDSDSESEEQAKDQPRVAPQPSEDLDGEPIGKEEPEEKPVLIKKSKEEIMQEVMTAVRRSLTEILLEVTDQEIHTVSQEELARYNAAQASRLNAMKASKSKALAAIASGLGLDAYDSSSGDSADEDDPKDVSDQQLQEMIKRKKVEFERTARDIEAEVRRAELRDTAEDANTPVTTPDRPQRSRSSATPPPIESETPEKKPERRVSKDKRNKSADKVDGVRRLNTIHEEKVKKTNKWEQTPSPRKATSEADSTSSTSSNTDDSSSSSSSSTPTDVEVKPVKPKKRKRASSNDTDSVKKTSKETTKRSHRTDEKSAKSNNDHDRNKSRHKGKDESDRHKSSRSDRHKNRHKEDSGEERPRKRSRRSTSYESRSGRRRSRDRSEEKSRRRDKRSYDRDRSYDRSGRDHDRSGRDHEKHDRYERRRSRSRSRSRHRR